NIDFCENATDKSVREYIAALFECGADYVEIDSRSAEYIKNVYTKERFIFKVDEAEDLEVLTRKSFAYVALPLDMLIVAEKAPSLNAIIEIDGDGRSAGEIVSICLKLQKTSGVSAIRVTKNFSDGINELECMLKRINDCELKLPLDICPLNIDLNGISNALCAYKNNPSGMVTLSFSSHCLYAPLESFLIYIHSKYSGKADANALQHAIAALYVTSMRYDLISDYSAIALKNISDTIKNCADYVFFADDQSICDYSANSGRIVKSPKDKKPQYTKIKQKYFDINEIDDDLCKSISDAVDDASMTVFNSAYKKSTYKA
ncbi:MAG: hypothetical protein NC228_04410, partial [[Eubacterium] siraeum]|nr:hypothetical protein [[Eubacterium] siraeum]